MDRQAQGRERVPRRPQAAPAPRGRVAAAVQAPPGAQPSGEHAQQPPGGAVCAPGRQLRVGHDGQDVRRQGEPAPRRDRQIDGDGWMSLCRYGGSGNRMHDLYGVGRVKILYLTVNMSPVGLFQ